MKDELVERIADAMMTEANRPENLLRCLDSYESWVLARACLSAIEAEGYVVVPRDEMDRLRNERDTLNDLLVEYGDALGRANTI